MLNNLWEKSYSHLNDYSKYLKICFISINKNSKNNNFTKSKGCGVE